MFVQYHKGACTTLFMGWVAHLRRALESHNHLLVQAITYRCTAGENSGCLGLSSPLEADLLPSTRRGQVSSHARGGPRPILSIAWDVRYGPEVPNPEAGQPRPTASSPDSMEYTTRPIAYAWSIAMRQADGVHMALNISRRSSRSRRMPDSLKFK